MKFSDLSIKAQILASFTILATISLIIISSLSVGNFVSLGENINMESGNALENQILTNMNLTSAENAKVIQSKFRNAESSVARIVKATEEVFSGDYSFTDDPVSYQDNRTEIDLPDSSFSASYGENISPTTSTYYYPDTALVNNQITTSMNRTISLSANLDSLLASIWQQNQEYAWLYISFNDGIFRNFPGAHVDDAREYEPIEEDYHIEGINARGDITYIPPYFDLTQGLVVSLAQAVYVNNIPIAVVGLDFKTTTIQQKVLDVNFLENGYAALYQANDLTVIAHKDWDSDNHDENDDIPVITEVEINLDSSSAYNISLLSQLESPNPSVLSYIKNGDRYLLSHAPIFSGSGEIQYIFTITVIASEILQPVEVIDADIQSSQNSVRSTLIVMSLITLVGTVLVGLWLSNGISRPISRLVDIAHRITANITKADIFEGINLDQADLQSDDEIGDLTRSFSSMVQTLREEQAKKKGK